MRAILFPGQGSQYIGMGADFFNRFTSTKKTFETADKTLGFSITDIILNGPDEKLRMTKNTQPAIMIVGVSIFNVLNKEFNFNLNSSKFFAGHSLGEYTALVCSGSLTLEKAVYLLHERGKFMQEAVPEGQGGMLAVLGMNINELEEEIKLVPKDYICEIANDNSNGQIVVSGEKKALEFLNDNLKKKKKKRNIFASKRSLPFVFNEKSRGKYEN